MRTFSLIDKDGASYDMTVKGKAFFYGISGLGYEKETAFLRIKERFTLADKKLSQQKIVGTVKFWQNGAEDEYFKFAQFCQNSPLKLKYREMYSRNGYVTKIERGDGDGKSLEAVIEFTAETPWYKTVTEYNYGSYVGGGKKYNYQYNYEYSDNASNEVSLQSDSWQSSPAKIIIVGPVTNPIWRHYHNGKLIATGKLNGSVLSGHRLIIDTTTIPYSITEVNENGELVADLYQSCDFSTERFIRIEHGNNTITVSATDATVIGLGVEAQLEYATV